MKYEPDDLLVRRQARELVAEHCLAKATENRILDLTFDYNPRDHALAALGLSALQHGCSLEIKEAICGSHLLTMDEYKAAHHQPNGGTK